MSEKCWYTIFTFTGQEEDLQKHLELLLKDIDCDVVIPKRERYVRKNNKMEIVTKTILPGYLFINVSMTFEIYYKIRSVSLPAKVLGISEDGIISVSNEEMDPILHFIDDQGVIRIVKGIVKGSKVEIIDEIFEGYHGIVTDINKHQRTVHLEVNMFNKVHKFIVGIDIVDVLKDKD